MFPILWMIKHVLFCEYHLFLLSETATSLSQLALHVLLLLPHCIEQLHHPPEHFHYEWALGCLLALIKERLRPVQCRSSPIIRMNVFKNRDASVHLVAILVKVLSAFLCKGFGILLKSWLAHLINQLFSAFCAFLMQMLSLLWHSVPISWEWPAFQHFDWESYVV